MQHKDPEQTMNLEHKEDDVLSNTATSLRQDVRTWQEQLIHGMMLSLAIVGPLVVLAGAYYAYTTQTMGFIPIYLLVYGALLVVAFWKRVPYAVKVLTFLAIIYALAILDFFQDGRGGSGRIFLLVFVSLSVLFFKRRTSVFALIFAILTFVGFAVAYTSGRLFLPPSQEVNSSDPTGWISNLAILLMMSILMLESQGYLVPRLTAALQRSRGLARDLETQRADLERLVAERTDALAQRARYLQTTADIARSVSSVLDIQALLSLVVRLISERFGFYHVGLFIVDPSGEWAVLEAASSEGGQRMLRRGHRLRLGQQGIVGDVTARGVSRIALDVGQDAVFFNNPDLPETRSEIALPLRARDEVIGALDVQSLEREAFSQDDANVLQTLADQVALAISNARLFDQAQESVEAERRAYGELSAEAWQALLRQRPDMGFVKQGDVVLPVSDNWDVEADRVVELGEPLQRSDEALSVPIKSGNQVIAVLDAHLPEGRGMWTSEQIALLGALSEQVSQAMERARLYQETQNRAAREQLVGEATGRIRETLNLNTVLQTAVREIGLALDVDVVEVRMGKGVGDAGTIPSEEVQS